MKRTYYEILGVPPSATHQEIILAFNRQALYWHPDNKMTITPGFGADEMRLLELAYATLANPEKRQSYDCELAQSDTKTTKTKEELDRARAVKQYEDHLRGDPVDIHDNDKAILAMLKKQENEFDRFYDFITSKGKRGLNGGITFSLQEIREILMFISDSAFDSELKEMLLIQFCNDGKKQLNRMNTAILLLLMEFVPFFDVALELLANYAKKLSFRLGGSEYFSLTRAIEENKFLDAQKRNQLCNLVRCSLYMEFNPEAFEGNTAAPQASEKSTVIAQTSPITDPPQKPTVEPKVAEVSQIKAEPPVKISIGDIQMGALIGRGAAGLVYQGKWNQHNVAVKKFVIANTSEGAKLTLDSLQKECEILGSLNHPQIVKLFAFASDEKNSEFCLVMEFCAKGSLNQYIYAPEQWNMTSSWTVDLLTQVSDGLAFMHSKNTLHQDLKPENILLRENGSAVLCDFGLSYTLKAEQTHKTTLNISGTPAFMDPILIKPTKPNEKAKKIAANDIYSFAMVAWCCLMKRIPYKDWELFQIMFHVASGDREELPNTTKPLKLAGLIKQCWAQDQNLRPTAAKVCETMHTIHKEEVGNGMISFPTKSKPGF